MDGLAESSSLMGMPGEYAFLLIGSVVGFLLGFFVGKLVVDPAAVRPGTPRTPDIPEPAAPETPGLNLVVNGRVVDIPSETLNRIHGLLQASDKIEAIKLVREATGMGLAEAKAVIDSLEKLVR